MELDRDLVVFEDDKGNEITMEVLDYFFYEGQEYAMLTDYSEEKEAKCADCSEESCEGCEPEEVVIMKVVPVGEDEEEFIPVDEELGEKLVKLIEEGAFDDDDFEDDDE